MALETNMEIKFKHFMTEFKGRGNYDSTYNLIKTKYGEEGRFYHNLKHVRDGLKELELVKNLVEDYNILKFAFWFHDIIYDPSTKYDDELESADLVYEEGYKHELSSYIKKKAHNLILATKHQQIPEDNDEKYMIDVDLSILGKPKEIFDKYDENIRKEYFFAFKKMTGLNDEKLFEEKYNPGRQNILKGFLNRDSIFLTKYFNENYEEEAIKNIEHAIKKLN